MSIWLAFVLCAAAAAAILWHHLAGAKAVSEALLREYRQRLVEARQLFPEGEAEEASDVLAAGAPPSTAGPLEPPAFGGNRADRR